MAKGRPRGIEDHHQVVGLLFIQDFEQHARKAERRACIFAAGIDQRIMDKGKIRPVRQRRTVDEKQFFFFGCHACNIAERGKNVNSSFSLFAHIIVIIYSLHE